MAVLMFSALPLPVLAQDAARATPEQAENAQLLAATDSATRLSNVVVEGERVTDDYNPGTSNAGAKTPTPIRDIPQSVTVVNRAVMDAQGANSLQDALRYVPGITFTAAEGGSIGNNINLRGFSARTDIFLDGFRDRGQYYRDAFSLDSVEVLEGPSSMLFGRGSTGGVINQVSKLPTMASHDELAATIGSNDQYRITGDFDHALSDTAAVRLPVMAQTVHSNRDVMHNQDYGAAPSLRVHLNDKTEMILSGLFEHNRDMADYGLPPLNNQPAPVSRKNFYGLTDDATVQDVQVFNAQFKFQLAPTLTLRNRTQYSRYSIDARETAANSVGTCSADPCTAADYTPLSTRSTGNLTALPLDQLYVQLGSHDRNIHDSSLFNQSDAIWKFTTGSIRHKLVVGSELGRDIYNNESVTLNNLPVISLSDPAHLSAAQAGVTATAGNVAQSSATTAAAYFNDTLSLGQYWKVVGGLRWDRFAASLTNSIPSSRNVAFAEQIVHFASVRGGVLYQPSEAQSYYLSYGTSADPSLESLTVSNGAQALPPEKNRSYEAGGKWDLLGGNLSLTSAVFQVEKTNARSQVSTGVYTLDGTVRVNGASLSAAGHITRSWQVFGGYTWLDAKVVEASALDGNLGKVPANTPRNNATLWTTYALTEAWSAGTGLVYSSSRFANANNTVSVDGFTRWDVTAAYHQPQYDVRLNLFNLADAHYFDSVIQSDGGRAVPGVSRSVQLTFTYRI
ncbi:MAG: TonB-dependent receptor [Stenotrophobium sp.]